MTLSLQSSERERREEVGTAVRTREGEKVRVAKQGKLVFVLPCY